jgi:histidinol-phosphate aminotransferase
MASMPSTQSPNALVSTLPEYVQAMVPYRPGKPIDEMKEEYGFDRVIKLASNENPFGSSPKAVEAARKSLESTHWYPDPVSRRLRRKIAATLNLKEDELVVGAGSESLLGVAIRALMKPGDKALTGEGAFMGFEIYLSAQGCQLIKVPSPNYRFDVDALIAAITPDIRIIYLPNPNNPTGTYITQAEYQKLLAHVPDTTLVLLDEAYNEFCGHLEDYPKSLEMRRENVLILRTFSKAHGLAGFRIGYGIGDARLIEQLSKVKMTFEPSMPAQAAAEAAWDDHEFLSRTVRNNETEKARYYEALSDLGMKYIQSVGNFILVECASGEEVFRLNNELLKLGIAIRPLASFGFPNCLRITIGLPDENDALFAALKTLL